MAMAMHGDMVTMHLIHSNRLNRRDAYWMLELLQQFSISSSCTDVSRRRWQMPVCGAEFPIQDWRGRVGFPRTHNWLIRDVTLLVGGMWKNSPACIICWLIEPLHWIYSHMMSNQQENTTGKAGSAVQATPERSLQEFIHQNKAAYQKMMSQGPSSAAHKIMIAECVFDFFLSLSIIFAPIIFFDGLESRHPTYWSHLIDERKYACCVYLILFGCSPCSVGMDPAGTGGLGALVTGWDFAGIVANTRRRNDCACFVK